MRCLLAISFLFSLTFVHGQECDCLGYYQWVRETFEQNDAGFDRAIERKGEQAYKIHNDLIEGQIEGVNDLHVCVKYLRDWTHFFRTTHVDVANINTPPNSPDVISFDVNRNEFKKYLSRKKRQDIEGIWDFDGTEIIFKKVENRYLGIVNESSDSVWKKGEVQFIIYDDGRGDYFNWEKSKWQLKKYELVTEDILKINSNLFLVRSSAKSGADSIEIEQFLNNVDNAVPLAKKLNDQTYYLKIPSFQYTEKSLIDSVILLHQDEILKTENLIIDLRGNGGGSDKSYELLSQFVYTNPYRSGGVEFRSTDLNNKRTLDIIDGMFGELSEEEKEIEKKKFQLLSKHVGEYVNLDENDGFSITENDEVTEFPKEVAIIINDEVGSTAEEFLMDAKQSKKVKLFGTPTMGALDVANQYYVLSPDKEIVLVYTLSRRINHMEIDDIGIQPDFYLDDSIPIYNWLEYIEKLVLEY